MSLQIFSNLSKRFLISAFSFCVVASNTIAAVLPEDRIDVLYHAYDGGGATIQGPSVLVRKGIGDSFSVSGNVYLDLVTSATIDVLASGASEYKEERTQYSLGVDYLRDKTITSFSYTNSSENDYEAETFAFGISQDFFGDLTNISLGITFGRDEVFQNVGSDEDPELDFKGPATHRRFSLGISQILTKDLLMAMSFETVVDEGFLNNPYRQIRSFENISRSTEIVQPEFYPKTRNSDAFAIRALYYLPYRASIRGEFRTYSDSWDIQGNSLEFRYTHPLEEYGLTLEAKLRGYSQTQAFFYSDIFDLPNDPAPISGEFVQFRGRDKELSEFSTATVGFGISYDIKNDWITLFERSSVNFYLDHMRFDYNNFNDRTQTANTGIGIEPLYQFNANVIRLFYSAWY